MAPRRLQDLAALHEAIAVTTARHLDSVPDQQTIDTVVQQCTQYQPLFSSIFSQQCSSTQIGHDTPSRILDDLASKLILLDSGVQPKEALSSLISDLFPNIKDHSVLTLQDCSTLLDTIYTERRIILQIALDVIPSAAHLSQWLKTASVPEEDWRIWFVQWTIDAFFHQSSLTTRVLTLVANSTQQMNSLAAGMTNFIDSLIHRHISYERLLMIQFFHMLAAHNLLLPAPEMISSLLSMLQQNPVCDPPYLLLLFSLVRILLSSIPDSSPLLQILHAQSTSLSVTLSVPTKISSQYSDIIESSFASSWAQPKCRAILELVWGIHGFFHPGERTPEAWVQEAIHQDALSWLRDVLLSSSSPIYHPIPPTVAPVPSLIRESEQSSLLYDQWPILFHTDLTFLSSAFHYCFTPFLKRIQQLELQSFLSDQPPLPDNIFECWLVILSRIYFSSFSIHSELEALPCSNSEMEKNALSYWSTGDNETIMSKNAYFLQSTMAQSASHPEMLSATLRFLASLVRTAPSNALDAFRFLSHDSTKGLESHPSWSRFFQGLGSYLTVLSSPQDQSNSPALAPSELGLFDAHLVLMYQIITADPSCISLLWSEGEAFHPGRGLTAIFFGLISSPISTNIKAMLWLILSRAASRDIQHISLSFESMLSHSDGYGIDGILNELNQVESRLESYPMTISFLRFLLTLLQLQPECWTDARHAAYLWKPILIDHGLLMLRRRSFISQEDSSVMHLLLVHILHLILASIQDSVSSYTFFTDRLAAGSPIAELLFSDVFSMTPSIRVTDSDALYIRIRQDHLALQTVSYSLNILHWMVSHCGFSLQDWFLLRQSSAWIGWIRWTIRATASNLDLATLSFRLLHLMMSRQDSQDRLFLFLSHFYPQDLLYLQRSIQYILAASSPEQSSSIIRDVWRFTPLSLLQYEILDWMKDQLALFQDSLAFSILAISGPISDSFLAILLDKCPLNNISIITVQLAELCSRLPVSTILSVLSHWMLLPNVSYDAFSSFNSTENWCLALMTLRCLLDMSTQAVLLTQDSTNSLSEYWTPLVRPLLDAWLSYAPNNPQTTKIVSSLYPDLVAHGPPYNIDQLRSYLRSHLQYLETRRLFTTENSKMNLYEEAKNIITSALHANQYLAWVKCMDDAIKSWSHWIYYSPAKETSTFAIEILEHICQGLEDDATMTQDQTESLLRAVCALTIRGQKDWSPVWLKSAYSKVTTILVKSPSLASRKACYMILVHLFKSKWDEAVQIESGALDRIVSDAAQNEALPLCCLALWLRRDPAAAREDPSAIREELAAAKCGDPMWKALVMLAVQGTRSTNLDALSLWLAKEKDLTSVLVWMGGILSNEVSDMKVSMGIARVFCQQRESWVKFCENAWKDAKWERLFCFLFVLERLVRIQERLDPQDRVILALFKRVVIESGMALCKRKDNIDDNWMSVLLVFLSLYQVWMEGDPGVWVDGWKIARGAENTKEQSCFDYLAVLLDVCVKMMREGKDVNVVLEILVYLIDRHVRLIGAIGDVRRQELCELFWDNLIWLDQNGVVCPVKELLSNK